MLKRPHKPDILKQYPPPPSSPLTHFSKRPRTERLKDERNHLTVYRNEQLSTHQEKNRKQHQQQNSLRENTHPPPFTESRPPLSNTREPSRTLNNRWNDPDTKRERRDVGRQGGPDRSFSKQIDVAETSKMMTAKGDDVSRSNNAVSQRSSQVKGSTANGEAGSPVIAVVSNLAWHVTMDDLWLLFGDIGELQEIVMKKDADGRFNGIAEVQYVNVDDAERCVETYSDVTFDRRAMRIRLIPKSHPLRPYEPKHCRREVVAPRNELMEQNTQYNRTRRSMKPIGEFASQRGEMSNRDGNAKSFDSRKDYPPKEHFHAERNNTQPPRNLGHHHHPHQQQQQRKQDRYHQQHRMPADRSPPPRQLSPTAFPDKRVSEREQYDEARRRQRNLRDRSGMRWDNNPAHPPPYFSSHRSGTGPGHDQQWPRNSGSHPMNPQHQPHTHHHHHRHRMDEEKIFRNLKRSGTEHTRSTFNPDQNVSRSNLPPPSPPRRSRSPPPRSDRRPVSRAHPEQYGSSLDYRPNGGAGRGPNGRFYPPQKGRNRARPY